MEDLGLYLEVGVGGGGRLCVDSPSLGLVVLFAVDLDLLGSVVGGGGHLGGQGR